MADDQVIHNTFLVERTFPARVDRVFAAFSDQESKRRWFGGSSTHNVEEFTMNFCVGGTERLLYRFNETTPFPGELLVNEGLYQDILPNRRIIQAQRMSMRGRVISSSLITFEFRAVGDSTELLLTHQGAFLEGSGGHEMRKQGWESLLDLLADELGR